MLFKNKITVERIIELEIWLSENNSIMNIEYDKLIVILNAKGFNRKEIEYLLCANKIPLSDIQKQLAIYDSSVPLMDELQFIYDLQIKYNTDRSTIIKRIRNARTISKYSKNNLNYVEDSITSSESSKKNKKKLIFKQTNNRLK